MSELTEPMNLAARPQTILVVEDEISLRFVIASFLREEGGFTVVEAQNADEALLYVRSKHPVDLVFTDVRMPGSLDGLALARVLATERPDLKLMATSGNMRPEERIAGLPFIPKPYDIEAVFSRIMSLLGEGEGNGK